MKIFVTGGAGFIGSHTCVELFNAGVEVVVYDNFSNSTPDIIERIEQITGKKLQIYHGDIRDEKALEKALEGCEGVIHFAGLKAVRESVERPLEYYDNNVCGTLCLLRVMQKMQIKKFIFSSSATVYGSPQYLPLTETHPLRTTNPYVHTKLVVEETLRALYQSDPSWSIVILRYLNPVGAHESGLIGENPQGIPNNLMPFVAQVAKGQRDYIHVVDIAQGHVNALRLFETSQCTAINLGTGKGYSVLEAIHTFLKVCDKKIAYTIALRRLGDIAMCYAAPSYAKMLLGWEAKYDLTKMCEDMWRFQNY